MTVHSHGLLSGAFIGVNVRSARRGFQPLEVCLSSGSVGASLERDQAGGDDSVGESGECAANRNSCRAASGLSGTQGDSLRPARAGRGLCASNPHRI
jgi:hypothetical protein